MTNQAVRQRNPSKEIRMTKLTKLSIATVAVVLGVASAALASGPGSTHGRSQSAPGHTRSQTTSSTGTSSTPTSNAKAFGRLCQGESKQHVAGQPGTPFSKCVIALAQVAHNPKTNPHRLVGHGCSLLSNAGERRKSGAMG